MIQVHVSRVLASARIPSKKTASAASYDLHAQEHLEIPPMTRARVRTGIRLQMPRGIYAMVYSRPPLAVKHGVVVLNAPAIIDSNYGDDELRVLLFNTSGDETFRVKANNAIAQLMFASKDSDPVTLEVIETIEDHA